MHSVTFRYLNGKDVKLSKQRVCVTWHSSNGMLSGLIVLVSFTFNRDHYPQRVSSYVLHTHGHTNDPSYWFRRHMCHSHTLFPYPDQLRVRRCIKARILIQKMYRCMKSKDRCYHVLCLILSLCT